MQPYRTGKPHASGCDQCAPQGAGHHLCQAPGCQNVAGDRQAARHATAEEYAAIPDGLKPLDGIAHMSVYGCDDCAEDAFTPFCDHTPPPAPPCPTCGATGDDPCTKKDRATPRNGWHSARTVSQPEPCTHAHREGCEIFTGCQCAGDDEAPARPRRMPAAGPGPDVSGLTIPVFAAQMHAAQHGIPWDRVAEARSMFTQDNRPAIQYTVRQHDAAGHVLYDDHGHEITETVLVPLQVA
jgi:hypothetical protein